MNVIRYHTKTGRPLGDERFAEKMERKMGRKFSRKLPGRARKQKIEYLGCVPILFGIYIASYC
jgi:hypothetical protein